MAKLYLMMGVPGAGKSTFVANHIKKNQIWVSRDTIRFNLVAEEEEYFSRETEVFNCFIKSINSYLSQGVDVFADATHLSVASRRKVLSRITSKPSSIEVIWIKTDLNAALAQNELRKGTRAYVPPSVIRRTHSQLEAPTFEEGFSTIYEVKKNKPILGRREM